MKGRLRKQVTLLVCLLAFCLLALHGKAVMFVSTGNPAYNTNAPTGSLTNAGWQYEGQWYVWLGTPIAPTFFLTAHHVNGNVGDPFILNGVSYTTVALFDDPNTDLRIWQVAQTFPYYAPLYTATDEVGKACLMIGRGTDRGPAVTTVSMGHTTTNGWQWGSTNNIERWGQNAVSNIYTDTNDFPAAQLLFATFQNNGATNECALSYNDSGGAMFIQEGGTWKLAGINYTVANPFVSTNGVNGSGLNAAVLDYFHLYVGGDNNWQQITQHESGGFYCTRVSARMSWINSIINPSPTAIFSGSPTNGAAPLTVTFTDSSTNSITNRFWNFGDGGTTNFAVATNPTHTYTAGVYNVTLIVSGPGGSSTDTVANLISAYDPFAWWQLSFFGCTNCAQAQPDADPYGSGMSNTNKFLASFNPTNAAAYVHVISIAV